MGAWGLGLFQSDHDNRVLRELDDHSELIELDVVLRAWQIKMMIVRRQRLQHLIEDCTRKTEEEQMLRNPFGAGYKTVILGACLMSLGCHLPDSFRALLERIYPHVGLMRNGLQQMDAALHGPSGYRDGVPYDFGSLDQYEMNVAGGAPMEDRKYPRVDLTNVPSPDEFAPAEALEKLDPQLKRGLYFEIISMKALGGEEVTTCGDCNAPHGPDNAKLLLCAKRKKLNYCGSECQRKAWDRS